MNPGLNPVVFEFADCQQFDSVSELLGKFDVIFCRNVAIYFSTEDRKLLFHRIADVLSGQGALIIGASEYLAGICNKFESNGHLRSVYYTLKRGVSVPSAGPKAGLAAKR